jgi:uncharacterized protein (TIGR00369 family)
MSPTPTPAQLRELMPFAALIGIELLEASPELVRGRLRWSPERCTAGGLLHGGALMALADTCGAACAFLNLPDGAQGTATIESKTNFLRPVRAGAVIARTRPLHVGRTLAVLETELSVEDGETSGEGRAPVAGAGALVAKVSQTQAYHYPRS